MQYVFSYLWTCLLYLRRCIYALAGYISTPVWHQQVIKYNMSGGSKTYYRKRLRFCPPGWRWRRRTSLSRSTSRVPSLSVHEALAIWRLEVGKILILPRRLLGTLSAASCPPCTYRESDSTCTIKHARRRSVRLTAIRETSIFGLYTQVGGLCATKCDDDRKYELMN